MKTLASMAFGLFLFAVLGPFVAAEELHTFKRIQLHDQFWSEGASFGDFNRDGVGDVVAGPWWWEGPDFSKRHEIYPATRTFDLKLGPFTTVKVPGFHGTLGTENHYSDNFFAFVYDFNADQWNDVLIVGFPGQATAWFENPKGEERHWKRHQVFDQTDNESPTFADITGDGKPELICITKGQYGYAQPDGSDPTQPWKFTPISPNNKYGNFTHGMGIGDVNGDGRIDLIEKDGWWEQPASLESGVLWKHHKAAFGSGGAQMYAYDVNGDGLNDVITSLEAHGFGLAWFEQYKAGEAVAFRGPHIILNRDPAESRYGVKFSEMHAIDLIDMDGDGLKDIVTGKRFWSHGRAGDPDRNNAAVLYWFRLNRHTDDSVEYVPYPIDDNSGVGTQVVAGDINGDGLPDIVVGNKKGVFIHLHEKKTVTREEWEAAQPKVVNPEVGITHPTLPASVDLRANFEKWNLPHRKQGNRNTCSVFTMGTAMEYALARKLDQGTTLSIEFLNWAANRAIRRNNDGHFFTSVIAGYERFGVCPEEQMPYNVKFDRTYWPSDEAHAAAKELKAYGLRFHWIRPNDGTTGLTEEHIQQMKAALAAGYPVCAGSYHSILLVGYADDAALPGGGQFLVRDSGGGNEQTITFEDTRNRMNDTLWISVE